MKHLQCLTVVVCLATMANAATVFYDSSATSTTNNSGKATVNLEGTLHPNPGWAAALVGSDWISYGSTGDRSDPGWFSPANGTIVTFTTSFFLSGTITDASLLVMADDTTSVALNGHAIELADKAIGPRCAAAAIGCLTSTEGSFTLVDLGSWLVEGSNTLKFGVQQVHGSSFGLDFAGTVTTDQTPEPATFILIGAGLVGLGALRRRPWGGQSCRRAGFRAGSLRGTPNTHLTSGNAPPPASSR